MDRSQLLKGVLDLAVLAVIGESDAYGYDVVRQLRDAGLSEVADASVYGTLQRLYANGQLSTYQVASDAGPTRKYYALNATGRTALSEGHKTWQGVVNALDGLLDPPRGARR
jgi:PadR family transcriptional regulator, regulatory protein PadR